MSPKVKIYLHFYIPFLGFILSLLIDTTDYYLINKQYQPFSMYTFADFEQVIIKIIHFSDFEQVIIKIIHFADFQRVIIKFSHFVRHA